MKFARRPLTTDDDRGESYELATLADPYGGVPITDPRMRGLRSRIRPILSAAHGPVLLVAFFIATLLHGVLVGWLSISGHARFMLQFGLFGLAAMFGAIVIRRHMLAAAPRIAAEYLREGVCPSCGYNLFGLNPADDGCIACPECGAAWRAARIQEAKPFDETRSPTLLDRHQEHLAPRQSFDRRTGTDHRGIRVELVTARQLRRLARDFPVDAVRLRLAATRIRARGRALRSVIAGFFALIGTSVVVVACAAGLPAAGGIWLSVCLSGGVTLALAALIARSELGTSARAIIAAARQQRVCAACGADLASAPTADDGCTICARCGAAWRLGDTEF